MNQRMIKAYLTQAQQYYSDSKGTLSPITAMNWRHALNAANRLLQDADTWAKEAGADPDRPMVWMTTQPLYLALVARSTGAY